MIHRSRAGDLSVERGECLSMGHITFENRADFACLPVAKYPDSATFVEEEVNLFQ